MSKANAAVASRAFSQPGSGPRGEIQRGWCGWNKSGGSWQRTPSLSQSLDKGLKKTATQKYYLNRTISGGQGQKTEN